MAEKKKIYYVIGLMSGSSLDGVDLAYCRITTGAKPAYKILHAVTYPYSAGMKKFLLHTRKKFPADWHEIDKVFGFLYAIKVRNFLKEFSIQKVDFVASHGHTILHNPLQKKTIQIGSGRILSSFTNLPVLSNFRIADVLAGGQGAPLVPVCDAYFFNNYHACLNIGGIANISYVFNGKRMGFDICPANQIFDSLAQKKNKPFDNKGMIAKSGKVHRGLLTALLKKKFFSQHPPKSLDNAYIEKTFMKTIHDTRCSVADKMRTVCACFAMEIASTISKHATHENIKPAHYKLLVTGGGAYNTFLIRQIEKFANIKIQLPDDDTIQYKESLAMCLMGVLRWENKTNFLPSVTGAKKAVSGGEIFKP